MQSLFKKKSKILIIVIGLIIMLMITIPSYFSKKLLWEETPIVENLGQIKSLRTTKIDFPNWKTIDQAEVQIGGHKWSFQAIEKDGQDPVLLLLLPPNDLQDKPEVEWMDINGFQKWDFGSDDPRRWKTDSFQNLTVKFDNLSVKTRFFRGWNLQQTFAVVQWYAFPNGGSPSPADWFWSDLFAQLHGQRIPWIAVCVKIPIEPLGDIKKVQPLAESLVKMIQVTLKEKFL